MNELLDQIKIALEKLGPQLKGAPKGTVPRARVFKEDGNDLVIYLLRYEKRKSAVTVSE